MQVDKINSHMSRIAPSIRTLCKTDNGALYVQVYIIVMRKELEIVLFTASFKI